MKISRLARALVYKIIEDYYPLVKEEVMWYQFVFTFCTLGQIIINNLSGRGRLASDTVF